LLEKEKLKGANFMDWYSNLRIVLRQEKIKYVLYFFQSRTLRTSLLVRVLQIAELMRSVVMMHSM
jgi:hypothetical protein